MPELSPSTNILPRSNKRRSKLTFQTPMITSTSTMSQSDSRQPTSTTTTSNTTTPSRSFIRICQKARRIRFFRNGDQYFKGIWYAISTERFRSFDSLLEDLTRSMVDLINLPHGVHYLFTIDGFCKISDLDDLVDGESYVCASTDNFKRIDYENAREPAWSYSLPKSKDNFETTSLSLRNSAELEPNDFVYPKIITVIRNGVKPRRVVRLLLNKRTARSFAQVIGDITVAIKLDSGVVRRLFSIDGNLVTTLASFFSDADVFVAYGIERISIDDFYIDSEENKFLFSSRARSTRFAKSPRISRVRLMKIGVSTDQILGTDAGNSAHYLSLFITSFALPDDNSVCPSPLLRRLFLNQRNQAWIGPTFRTRDERLGASIIGEQLKQAKEENDNIKLQEEPSSSTLRRSHPFEIENRFAIGRSIGDGNFATVHECICKRTKMVLALKVIDKTKCKEELVRNEVAILGRLKHEHIVQLHDVWDFDQHFYLSMELIPVSELGVAGALSCCILQGGDLFDALCSIRRYSECHSSHLLFCLASALDYLHSNAIVHRDIKPENLLVYSDPDDDHPRLKVADFGLATSTESMLFIVCGTPTYVAPEILIECGYGTKVDIWAAGIILYVMLCGFPPFQSMHGDQDELFDQILKGQYTFPEPCWDCVSSAAKGLIQGMLQMDVQDRYSAEEVLIHPWISSGARVDPEYEQLAALAVQSQLRSDADATVHNGPPRFDDMEYYYSRRRSMDDLSAPPSQTEESDRDLSFEYCTNPEPTSSKTGH